MSVYLSAAESLSVLAQAGMVWIRHPRWRGAHNLLFDNTRTRRAATSSHEPSAVLPLLSLSLAILCTSRSRNSNEHRSGAESKTFRVNKKSTLGADGEKERTGKIYCTIKCASICQSNRQMPCKTSAKHMSGSSPRGARGTSIPKEEF